MGDIFKQIIIFCEVLGIMTICFALLKLAKISKEHKNLNDEEYLHKENRLVRNKYLLLAVVGLTFSLLMQVFIILTR